MSTLYAPSLVQPGNTLVVLGRLLRVDQTLALPADVQAITWQMYNQDTAELIDEGSLTASDVVFNPAKTDYGWLLSLGAGYNFRHIIDGEVTAAVNSQAVLLFYRMEEAASPNYPIVCDPLKILTAPIING